MFLETRQAPRLLDHGLTTVGYCPSLYDNRGVGSASTTAQALGRAIRERREVTVGISQEEAAHRAAVTVRHYQKIEYGETDPGLDLLLRVAKALETTLQALLDRADELRATRPRKR